MTRRNLPLSVRLLLVARVPLGAWLPFVLACGDVEAEGPPVLEFETQPTCPAANASCLNVGTSTFSVDGVRVIYKPLPGHPLVSFRISFEAGIGSSQQRWAETLALSLFDMGGPRRLYTSEWNAELLRLGAVVSASNGLDYGTISASVPALNWRELWNLVIEGMAEHRNGAEELDNRRGIYERAFESERDDPDSAASLDGWSRLFQGQAYNYQREHADVLATLTSREIDYAWVTLAEHQRCVVTVIGDVSADDVRSALTDALSRLSRLGTSAAFAPDSAPAFAPAPAIQLMSYPDAPTWYLQGYFKGPSGSSPDLAPLELGLNVLDQRLFDEVRDVRGLAYTTGASLAFYRESYGKVWLTSESPLEALSVSRQVLADLKATGPTEAELEGARRALLTRLLSSTDTPSGIASLLADWELTAGAREMLDDHLAALERTTPDEVVGVLAAYLRDVKIAPAGGGSSLVESDIENWFVSP